MAIQSNFPAIKPTLLLDFANTKQLDPRITFTRASTGTYYDGKTVAKAEENLLIRSQEFESSSWVKNGSSATANTATAPDGTATADSLIESSTTSEHYATSPAVAFTSGLDYTMSCFVKPNGRTWFRLSFPSTTFPSSERFAYFDVQNGVLGTVATNVTATITSAGNGWYRCAISRVATASATANTFVVICDADNNTSYTGNGTSGLYLWGAQLEQRSSVTAYTATTTQPITNYVPQLLTAASGVARFEHNPTTGESLGLEIEESRTNLLVRSEEFDNASWAKNNVTITASAVVAPNGGLTGDKLVETATTAIHRAEQTITVVSGALYTLTVYAKAAERNFLYLFEDSGSGSATFNLSTGVVGTTIGSVTTQITSVGNGWYRCALTVTQSGTIGRYRIALANSTVGYSYTGDGYSGIYIWGAQLEAGAFPTSYIPTVASQVTRAADAASMTGTNFSSWYAADQGTLYAEAQYPNPAVTGKTHEWVSLFETSSGINLYEIRAFSSTVRFAVQGTNTVIGTGLINLPNKAAFGFTASGSVSQVGSLNGAATTSASTAITRSANALSIGAGGSSNALSGTIKKIAYYPARVTNAQLQALTS